MGIFLTVTTLCGPQMYVLSTRVTNDFYKTILISESYIIIGTLAPMIFYERIYPLALQLPEKLQNKIVFIFQQIMFFFIAWLNFLIWFFYYVIFPGKFYPIYISAPLILLGRRLLIKILWMFKDEISNEFL